MDTSNPPPCPKCGSAKEVVPVLYGYATRELMEEARQGKFVLGGCVLSSSSPDWYCKACKHPDLDG